MISPEPTRHPFELPSVGGSWPIRTTWSVFKPLLERVLCFPGLNRLHAAALREVGDTPFAQRVLDAHSVTWNVTTEEVSRIPAKGPLVIVANHPFGALEGLVLLALVQSVRDDVQLLGNHLLGLIPELQNNLIPVDVFEAADSKQRNIAPIRNAVRWLADGKALIVFPAGEVSHLTWKNRRVIDPPWNNQIARLIQRAEASVLPIFFNGCNGWLFQLAALIHPRLRTALLPRELLTKRGHVVDLRIGGVIPPVRTSRFQNAEELSDFLRLRTYVLKGKSSTPNTAKAPSTINDLASSWEPIAAPPDNSQITNEIRRLPDEHRLVQSGSFSVYFARAPQIPHTLAALGHLREKTFRQIGEGTGKSIDRDRFDESYLHLFVWNDDARELVGAYRMGPTDEILESHGKKGLYTHSLFRYRSELLEQIGPALELGRSFILPEYQKSYSSLMLLWKGIGRYVSAHPRYRMLFGAVSISDDYTSMTKQMLVAFLRSNRQLNPLSRLIRPINPPRFKPINSSDRALFSRVVRNLEDVDELVSEIESDRKPIPVLLRQYLKLNGKLLAFNVDPEFGNALDGLILVDLAAVEPATLSRYLGRDGADSFLSMHRHAAAPNISPLFESGVTG